MNEIDTDSLLSLSMYFAVSMFTPIASDVSKALSVMDGLFSKIMQHGLLPTGTDWMDQLDVLGCVRISDVMSASKLEDIYLGFLKQRFACGFKKDSDIYVKALGLLSATLFLPVFLCQLNLAQTITNCQLRKRTRLTS